MVVSRRGDQGQHVDRGYEFLGRLLVTIDDLEALIALIVEHSPEGTDAPQMEFVGGTFTEPGDLRTLTDNELKEIEVVNSKVEVHLSDWRATAAGDRELASIVSRAWARPRQTNALPKGREYAIRAERVLIAVVLVIAVLLVPVLDWLKESAIHWSWAIPTLAVVTVLSRALLKQPTRRLDSYAVIVPSTLDEYRKEQMLGRRQLVTWLIATSAIAVTLFGVLIGMLIKR
jgi:hypothetical protein